MNKQVNIISLALGCALLPSCSPADWFKTTNDKMDQVVENKNNRTLAGTAAPVRGELLVALDGVPVITVESLQSEKDKLLSANPQLKAMIAFMDPKQFDRNLVEGLTNQVIVDKYVVDNNIINNAAYQAELQEGYKAIERMINTKYFSDAFKVNVSDADVRKFYDENKDLMPNLLISRGGIKATGVMFTTQQDADAFAQKVRAKKGNALAAAKEAGLADDKVKDFKSVHEQSVGIEAPLRDAVVKMKTVPSVEVVSLGNNAFWVVSGTEKEESKYQPFDQVKASLKAAVEKEKRAEMFEQAIERLKNSIILP